jgi:hypothetical protein
MRDLLLSIGGVVSLKRQYETRCRHIGSSTKPDADISAEDPGLHKNGNPPLIQCPTLGTIVMLCIGAALGVAVTAGVAVMVPVGVTLAVGVRLAVGVGLGVGLAQLIGHRTSIRLAL